MISSAVKAKFDTLRSLNTLTSSYVAIGTALSQPGRIIKITNYSNVNILISTDGTNAHDTVGAGGFTLYDFGSDRAQNAELLEFPAGKTFYAKIESGSYTSGSVYLTEVYASLT